jgi:isopenicillin-N epimerase
MDLPKSPLYMDPLQDELFAKGIEVPIIPWPDPPRRLVRVSAQVYNERADYERLVEALGAIG